MSRAKVRRMSEVAFLVGEPVAEIRDGNRIVFKAGDNTEPALYADEGRLRRYGRSRSAAAPSFHSRPNDRGHIHARRRSGGVQRRVLASL